MAGWASRGEAVSGRIGGGRGNPLLTWPTKWLFVILLFLCVVEYRVKPLLTWGPLSGDTVLYVHNWYLCKVHIVVVGVLFT